MSLQESQLRREDVEDHLLDVGDQPVDADVVVAQSVGQRFQEVGPEVADRLAQRVVGEQVAEQRQLDAEDLALQRILQDLQEGVEAVNHG